MFTNPAETPTTAPKPAVETGAPRKFMFDLSFDAAAPRAPERKPVLMKPDQIDALKKESHDLGFDAGKEAGKAAQTAALAALMEKVDGNIDRLMQNIDALRREQDVQTRTLVLAVARKILPDFAARGGLQEIEAVLDSAIRDMAREPRLVVRVQEAQFDAVNETAQNIAARRAYGGKIIVLADASVAAGDCRIEWADGGIERNTKAAWDAVEQTINPSS